MLDDTLVYYIIGDNGASAEGTLNGTFNEMIDLQRRRRTGDARVPDRRKIDEFGRPDGLQPLRGGLGARDGHAVPVDQAGRLALGRHPQRHDRPLAATASSAKGEVRAPVPPRHRRRADHPRGGRAARSRRSSNGVAAGADRRRQHGLLLRRRRTPPSATTTQYFEMFGNRGIYHQGWTAVTRHCTPWVMARQCPPSTTTSGSCTTQHDWTQAHDLAAEMPEKLAELQRLCLIEAARYNVLPLDDRRVERFNSDLAGRPHADQGRHPAALRRHGRLSENSVLNIKNKSHCGHRRGRRARGRRRGRDHRPGRQRSAAGASTPRTAGSRYCYNCFGLAALHDRGRHADPGRHAPGAHGVRLRRRRAGQGRHRRRSTSTGTKVGEGRVERDRCRWSSPPTRPATSAATRARPVSADYGRRGNAFTGTVNWVQIDLGEEPRTTTT